MVFRPYLERWVGHGTAASKHAGFGNKSNQTFAPNLAHAQIFTRKYSSKYTQKVNRWDAWARFIGLLHSYTAQSKESGTGWERERPSDGVAWTPTGFPVDSTTTTSLPPPKQQLLGRGKINPGNHSSSVIYFVQGLLVVSNMSVACVQTGVSNIYLL
jgi:hypothetical protein